MALNVKDEEAVRLAGEVAAITGESKTRGIRVALQERLDRLEQEANRDQQVERLKRKETVAARRERLKSFLENEVWPLIPPEERGKPITKKEREEILGYGEHGV